MTENEVAKLSLYMYYMQPQYVSMVVSLKTKIPIKKQATQSNNCSVSNIDIATSINRRFFLLFQQRLCITL